jgi:extracellular elastinolytic metalloproteinase
MKLEEWEKAGVVCHVLIRTRSLPYHLFSDFVATLVRSTEVYSDYPFGAWAKSRESGLRVYLYSISREVNPTVYSYLNDIDNWGSNHKIGQIWAQMLWEVAQELIAEHGFSPTLFPPETDANGDVPDSNDFYRPRTTSPRRVKVPLIPKHGNTLMLQLVMNGMKLLPCEPTFVNARDAIIQADSILTGGENYCRLWRGFAKRGLGPKAGVLLHTPIGGILRKDDFEVPSLCK